MIVRVALLSPADSGQEEVLSRLRLHPSFQVGLFTDLEVTRLRLAQWPFQTLVMRVDRIDDSKLAMAEKLRALFPKQGLLFTGQSASAATLYQMSKRPGCAALVEKRELADLTKIVEKLSHGEACGPRAHPRTKRSDRIEIVDAMGRPGEGKFLDFGPMGARIQATSMGLARKSQVTISYRSASLNGRIQKVAASVAWVGPATGVWDALLSPLKATETVGLRFIATTT